jgi:GH25 family lysozyme M1 (1,4-beta-N-acetylmuramidase)
MTYARLVDVSHHQGRIDWRRVAGNWDAAVCRMTIGRTTLDDLGVTNLRGMLATSLIPGAYGVVGTAEPVEDGARLLVDQIERAGADPADTLIMLDAEDFTDGTHPTISQVDRYARRLHDLTGRWPVAYVPLWWLGKHAYTVTGLGLANCPWAQSRYYTSGYWSDAALAARRPALTHGWRRLGWLQYTDKATVAGIAGGVDANVFYGTTSQLRTQLLGATTKETDVTVDELVAELTNTDSKLYAAVRRIAAGGAQDTLRTAVAGGADNPAGPYFRGVAAVLKTISGQLDAGLQVGLTPEQVADLKAALPTLEGSALIQLAVSPPAATP